MPFTRPDHTPAGPVPTQRLRRALNTPLLTLYGLGVTVGAGIYVLVGATAAQAGPHAPVSFLIAAFVVAFTAFSYAELSTRYPVSAGEAAYVAAGFGDRAAWLTVAVGLAVALSGMVSAAAVAIGAASYLHDLTALPRDLLMLGVVATMGGIALWGIAQSVAVAAVITVIEISGLLLVIFWGLFVAEHAGVALADLRPPPIGPQWVGIGAASLLAFFAFVGFEDMANVAEEVRDPIRALPRAILWTLVMATVLYVGTTVAVLLAVPLARLSGSAAPLLLVFETAPQGLRQSFSVIAVVATINGVLIQMIMASRVLFGLADRGHLPAPLAMVSERTRTPVVATLTVVAAIVGLAWLLPIDALAERTSQIVLTVFVLVNAALIRLKLRAPPVAECFRVPLFVPVMGMATSVMLFGFAFL
ncbi:MAG: amino acid permease [Rhodobacteraceae bacterium]|nr:amino acid permease [Paracoccaceae bacterium]